MENHVNPIDLFICIYLYICANQAANAYMVAMYPHLMLHARIVFSFFLYIYN